MKVMHVIVGLETGGAESMLCRLVTNMPNHSHTIVSLTNIGSIGRDLVAKGYTINALCAKPSTIIYAFFRLWRLIRRDQPDVIQTWMYHADLLGGLAGRLAGISNVIWNIRNTEIPQRSISVTGLVVRLCAMLSRTIPKSIICCSRAGVKSHAMLGFDHNRMIVIPNGFDTKFFMPPLQSKKAIRSLLGLPHDSFIIGIVGRFDPLKGHDNFVEAAGIIAAQRTKNYNFLMVGRDIDCHNSKLNSIILKKGGQAKFILLGERKDIPNIMYSLDVLCLASKAEGFPNVVAEAMLMQVPCVVTDVGDAALIVGQAGRVVPPCNPHALAKTLMDLELMPHGDLQAIGFAARRRVVDSFGIHTAVKRYEEVYSLKA